MATKLSMEHVFTMTVRQEGKARNGLVLQNI